MVGGDREGEDQESVRLFHSKRGGSNRIPSAFIKADNGRGKSNVCWQIKENKRASVSLSLVVR